MLNIRVLPCVIAVSVMASTQLGCSSIGSVQQFGSNFSQHLYDHEIETKSLKSLYELDNRFNFSRINVHAFMGVVLITGQVSDQYLIDIASQHVAQQNGVKAVHNYLTTLAKPTLVQIELDKQIQNAVTARLQLLGNATKDTQVITESSVVYIMGKVNQFTANQMVSLLQSVPDMKKVTMLVDLIEQTPAAVAPIYKAGDVPNIPLNAPSSTSVPVYTLPTPAPVIQPTATNNTNSVYPAANNGIPTIPAGTTYTVPSNYRIGASTPQNPPVYSAPTAQGQLRLDDNNGMPYMPDVRPYQP